MPRLSNTRHEKFCHYFVFGNPHYGRDRPGGEGRNGPDTLRNATQSYVCAGYRTEGHAAEVSASRLLRRTDIQERIAELRKEAGRLARLRSFNWDEIYPTAQQTLIDAILGQSVTSAAVSAAKAVIDRCDGILSARSHLSAEKEVTPVYVLGYGDSDGPPESFEKPPPVLRQVYPYRD